MNVSIIVPVYCETDASVGWMGECIDSLLGQHGVREIVLWNDGSKADLSAIWEQFSKTNSVLLKFGNFPQTGGMERRGVSFARNSAVSIAAGPLLFPVDCDDVLAPGAISKLVERWDGVPLYPDVYKFGDEEVNHYQLLEFACEHLLTKVGVASVGVLHSKAQWEVVGGWDESIDFYEDGEYNARLMLNFCGRRYPEPLYGYRIHDRQRTKLNKNRSAMVARSVISKINDYWRRMTMSPCPGCGSRRTGPAVQNQPSNVAVTTARPPAHVKSLTQRIAELPGATEGRVWAHYVGGSGKGKHYYQGPSTKFLYKVLYDGIYEVDAKDASDPNDPNHLQVSLFVRVRESVVAQRTEAPAPTPNKIEVSIAEPVVRAPVVGVLRTPVLDKAVDEGLVKLDEIDLDNLSYRELVLLDLTPEQASRLLALEKANRARKGHLAYLGRLSGGA